MSQAFALVGLLLIAGWGRAAGAVLLLASVPGLADALRDFIHHLV